MAELAGVFATAHSPGLTGFPDRVEPAKRDAVRKAFDEVAARIEALRPDTIVAVSVEHFTNFFLANLPAFAIVTAEAHLGPGTPEMAGFLGIAQRRYRGDRALGAHLYRYALDHDFDPALADGGFDFDENFCVPLELLRAADIPVVPVIVNGVNPPYPTARRCYAFGRMLAAAIAAGQAGKRVVVLATGGLSHWVGTPQAGTIDEGFDRDFLARLASGDSARLTDYDDEAIEAAGNGAQEIRAWLVAAGAAGVPFDTLAYQPTPEWLTGTAVAAARM